MSAAATTSLAPLLKDWADATPYAPSLLGDPSFLSRHAAISRDAFKSAAADACAPALLKDLAPFVAEVASRAPSLGAGPLALTFALPSARARPIKTASNLQVQQRAFAL